jgi:hypothetical protein
VNYGLKGGSHDRRVRHLFLRHKQIAGKIAACNRVAPGSAPRELTDEFHEVERELDFRRREEPYNGR